MGKISRPLLLWGLFLKGWLQDLVSGVLSSNAINREEDQEGNMSRPSLPTAN